MLLSGCYREQPAQGIIDLSEAPSRVALLFPLEGVTLDFGTHPISSTTEVVLTLKNLGLTPASSIQPSTSPPLTSPWSIKDQTFPGTGGTCTSILGPQESCTVVLTFSPTTVGIFMGEFNFSYNNGLLIFPMTVALVGTATSPSL